MTKIAVIQKASKFLDKSSTIASAVKLIDEAGSNGSELIVFYGGVYSWISSMDLAFETRC